MPYTDASSDDIYKEPIEYEFHPRLTKPPHNSKFWNRVGTVNRDGFRGGISTCTKYNPIGSAENYYNNALKNCVSYAWGRFNEIGYGTTKFKTPAGVNRFVRVPGNPPQIIRDAYAHNLKVGNVPKLGALICWRLNGSSTEGHVAVVEEINADGSIVTSESGYGDDLDPKRGYDFAVCTRPSKGN